VAAQDTRPIKHQLTLSQFTGHPIFFFDTSVLLDNVVSIADWNPTRLEAAIAPRIERVLDGAGIRIATDTGFHMIFVNHTPARARAKADAVRADLLIHFYGPTKIPPEVAAKFGQPSSLVALAGRLGIPAETLARARTKAWEPIADDPAEKNKAISAKELQDLFLDAVASKTAEVAKFGKFLFSPLWDCKKSRVSAFSCAAETLSRQDTLAPVRLSATDTCRHDIVALAAATRGIRHILSSGHLAAVSAPVHVETLSWSNTCNAYLEALGRIDCALLALRIVGLEPGANLLKIGQWTVGLRRYVRLIFVHLPDVNFDFGRVGALGVAGYGLTAASPEEADAKSLNLLSAQALKLTRICTIQNASAVIDNVRSEPELAIVKNQGVRFIVGPVIGSPEEVPAIVKFGVG